LTREEFVALSEGRLPSGFNEKGPVGENFSRLYRLKRLRPVVAFKYFREAYVHPTGNVRVTFDSSTPGGCGIMELKYNRFLPCFVSELLTGVPLTQVENSKYCTALHNRLLS
jgi:hypothetical protein